MRGGLVDLFPMGSALPYRIDLFDNEIETIRTFDVDTQRSIYPVKEVRLLPAREFPLDEAGIRTLSASNFREKFEGDPSKSRLYKDVSNGLAPPGIEYYLPLFFEHTATLFDYLPQDALLCLHHGPGSARHSNFWRDTQSRYQLLRGDRDRPLLPPEELFLPVETLVRRHQALSAHRDQRATQDSAQPSALPCRSVQVDRRADNPVQQAATASLPNFDGRILLLAESLGRRETMAQYPGGAWPEAGAVRKLCRFPDQAQEHFMLGAGPLSTGFVLPASPRTPHPSLAFITETELYATQVRQIAPPRGSAQEQPWKTCCATCPSSRSATRWCTSSTASAAISAWSTWIWAKAKPSFCIWNMPAATSSTCRSPTCT